MLNRRISRRATLRLLAGGGIASVVAACGGGKNNGTNTSTSTPGPSAVSQTPTVSPTPAPLTVTPTATPGPFSTTPARVDQNIDYGPNQGLASALDIYYSSANLNPAPLVIFVHGGSFTTGGKETIQNLTEFPELLSRGYTVASVNYRLGDQGMFPNPVYDVKAAIRFLRTNAATYGLDPDRFGAWGRSAGGYLVSMAGLTDPNDGLEGDEGNPGVSTRVTAVVDQFGPVDFSLLPPIVPLVEFLGPSAGSDPDLLNKASPVAYITADDPPFLVMQGELDPLVPLQQSQTIVQRLTAAGVPAQLVVVHNAGHDFNPIGGDISPTETEIATMVGDFFDKHLKP